MNLEIEKKISENKSYFDSSQPDDGHLERFVARLDMTAQKSKRSRFLTILSKVAAVFLLLVIVSFVAYSLLKEKNMGTTGNTLVYSIEYSPEMNEILDYYDASSVRMLDSITRYASDSIEAQRIKSIAQDQMIALDANMALIEKEYMKNPENKELSAALINNKRKKVQVVEQIVRQLDLSNKGLF